MIVCLFVFCFRGKIAVADAEKLGALRKLEIATLDFVKKESLLRSLRSKVDAYEIELQANRCRIMEMTKSFNEERIQWSLERSQLEDSVNDMKVNHQRELERIKARLDEREAMLRLWLRFFCVFMLTLSVCLSSFLSAFTATTA